MSRHMEIGGIVMRPCSTSAKENEDVMMSTDYSTNKDFLKKYNNYIAAMQITAECAKVYIEKNWKKIKDWSFLNLIVIDNTGKKTEYFNYIEGKIHTGGLKAFDRMLNKIDRQNKKKHNPITSIKKVVLDHSDGDFSLTINGKNHMWIDNESVIIIANYIEQMVDGKFLKELKKTKNN